MPSSGTHDSSTNGAVTAPTAVACKNLRRVIEKVLSFIIQKMLWVCDYKFCKLFEKSHKKEKKIN
jgi:hypothetical protein